MTVVPGFSSREAGTLLEEQAQVLERIARGAPLPDVLSAIALLIERHAAGAVASILLLDDHGKLRPGVAPGLPDSSRGLRAAWSTPIPGASGAVLGTIALYYLEPRSPAPRDEALIAVATHLAGIAIERRRAEEQLRIGEERLRLLGKATDDAVWDWDLTTGSLWWGEGAHTLAGIPSETLGPDANSWTSRVHPDDRDRVIAGIHAVIDGGGRGWTDEYRFRRADGSYAHVLDRGYVIRDELGHPVRMVGSMMDLTERSRAHAALAARERQFREAQRVARLGSWEWEPGSARVTWSDEMYHLYGLTPVRFEPTSDAILALIAPEDRAVVRQATERCLAEQRAFAYDIRVRRPDGAVRILHCRGHAVVETSRQVTRLLGTAQDVTERRQIEERLRDSQRRLRALTARREAILEDERARISREIHDELGQILTASKLDVAWVRDSLPDAPAEIRTRLADLAGRLDATVKTVRRITTELRPVVLDQLGLAAAVEWLVRDFAHRTGLACSVRASLDGHVLPDETATCLFRILQEALTNVARHAGADTVRVELWAVDHTVCLEVIDDGRGITDAEAARGDGLGIMGMRERAILFGGALELGAVQPSGTRLSVWAPLR
jgi:PAS domain S-box-containing protein